MDNAFSLFRVFDVAFFLPGAVLLLGLRSVKLLDENSLALSDQNLRGIAIGVVAVLGSYLSGLLCHGVQRLVYRLVRHFFPAGKSAKSWYEKLSDKPAHKLAFYFWYMRATSWNLAVALLVIAALAAWYEKGFPVFLGMIIGAAAFALIGSDFHSALRRASETA